MKKILILLLFPTFMCAQYVPIQVEKRMYDTADYRIPIDTVELENHDYIFRVKGDSTFVRWQLLKIDRLYFDPFKAAGVTYFLINMSAFTVLPDIDLHRDKYYHLAAGWVIGAGVSIFVYHKTHHKWLAFGAGLVSSVIVGAAKEWRDSKYGGVASWKDWGATTAGGLDGAGGVVIIFGHKEKVKCYKRLHHGNL